MEVENYNNLIIYDSNLILRRDLHQAILDYITSIYSAAARNANDKISMYYFSSYSLDCLRPIILNIPDQLLKTLIEITAKHNIGCKVYKYCYLIKNKYEYGMDNFCQKNNIEVFKVTIDTVYNNYILLTDNISAITQAKLTY